MIGLHTEPNKAILITGNKKLKLYPLSSRKLPELIGIFETLQPEYLRGEHLIISSRNGDRLTILTSKRLVITDISEGMLMEIQNKKIVGAEVTGGFLKKDQLHVLEDSGVVTKHPVDVDDPVKWKDRIGECVRSF